MKQAIKMYRLYNEMFRFRYIIIFSFPLIFFVLVYKLDFLYSYIETLCCFTAFGMMLTVSPFRVDKENKSLVFFLKTIPNGLEKCRWFYYIALSEVMLVLILYFYAVNLIGRQWFDEMITAPIFGAVLITSTLAVSALFLNLRCLFPKWASAFTYFGLILSLGVTRSVLQWGDWRIYCSVTIIVAIALVQVAYVITKRKWYRWEN